MTTFLNMKNTNLTTDHQVLYLTDTLYADGYDVEYTPDNWDAPATHQLNQIPDDQWTAYLNEAIANGTGYLG